MKRIVIIVALFGVIVSIYSKTPEQRTQNEVLLDSISALNQRILILTKTKSLTVDCQQSISKLENIRGYVKICQRRPANKKFFYGWVKRALNN